MSFPRTVLNCAARCLLLFLVARTATAAPIDWPTLALEEKAAGLNQPTSLTHAGDGSGRLFVTEQTGVIRIIRGTNLLAAPLLSIPIFSGGEKGLLGLAFPPGFTSSRHFYVAYTRSVFVVVSRFSLSTTNDDIANAASEQVLLNLRMPLPEGRHFGGKLAFGPDGFLYAFIGDGGDFSADNVAQNPQSLFGKVLRLDTEGGSGTNYSVPSSNPFSTNAAYRPEIWALGLRNPWGAAFDRLTGDLYIPDVGDTLQEEINFQGASSRGGENYGWNWMEGNAAAFQSRSPDPRLLTSPVFTYRGGAGPAIVGGAIYRGTNFTRMQGVYFFGDFGVAGLWGMHRNGSSWEVAKVLSLSPFVSQPLPSGFGEDENGDLYLLAYNQGRVLRLVDTLQCHPPVAGWTNVAHGPAMPVTALTPGCRTHYTVEDREPTAGDPFVLSGQAIPLTAGVTYRLRAFRDDLQPSVTVTSVFSSFQVATPMIGAVKEPAGVLLSAFCSTPGASIRYTTDGSPPMADSTLYQEPILAPLPGPALFAGFAEGYDASEVGVLRNPVILSHTMANNLANLMVWIPVSMTVEPQSSFDLVTWLSHGYTGSNPTTNLVSIYRYNPTNSAGKQFFRTGRQKLRGPSGDVP